MNTFEELTKSRGIELATQMFRIHRKAYELSPLMGYVGEIGKCSPDLDPTLKVGDALIGRNFRRVLSACNHGGELPYVAVANASAPATIEKLKTLNWKAFGNSVVVLSINTKNTSFTNQTIVVDQAFKIRRRIVDICKGGLPLDRAYMFKSREGFTYREWRQHVERETPLLFSMCYWVDPSPRPAKPPYIVFHNLCIHRSYRDKGFVSETLGRLAALLTDTYGNYDLDATFLDNDGRLPHLFRKYFGDHFVKFRYQK